MWSAVLFLPWRAWPRILAERRDASWLYLLVGLESLFIQPDHSLRTAWALGRRGAPAIMPLLRLASTQIVWALGLSVALSLFLRVTRKGFAFGELLSLTPWAYAPKLVVSFGFAVAWLAGWDGFFTAPYVIAAALAIGVSIASLLRVYDSTAPLPPLPGSRAATAFAVATLLLGGAYVVKAQADPVTFRPLGRGDVVQALHLGALTGPARTITFPTEQPILIDFWASWCGPCVAALPAWQQLRAEGVTLVSANVEPDNTAYVRNFIRENNFTFEVMLASGELQSRFQVDTLPTLVGLSRTGEVIVYHVGAGDAQSILDALKH